MVICDIVDEETGEPVEVAPRQILKRQIERAADAGFTIKTGSELEFYLFQDSFEELAERGYRELRPSSTYIMDYHMLQTTKDEWIIRQIRNGMLGAGIPVEFSKGEFGRASTRSTSRTPTRSRPPTTTRIYKHGVKEIAAANGVAATFMAKYTMAEAGSSCHLHSSLWSADGTESLMWDAEAQHHMSETFRWYLGGLMAHGPGDVVDVRAVRELVQEVPARVVGADGHRVEPRQPHVRVPDGRRGQGRRVECRIPGADANPYLAFAATIAGGLVRHREQGRAAGDVPRQRVRGEGRAARARPRCTRRSTRSARARSRARPSATSCSSTC